MSTDGKGYQRPKSALIFAADDIFWTVYLSYNISPYKDFKSSPTHITTKKNLLGKTGNPRLQQSQRSPLNTYETHYKSLDSYM